MKTADYTAPGMDSSKGMSPRKAIGMGLIFKGSSFDVSSYSDMKGDPMPKTTGDGWRRGGKA